jgi:hypothetical protein
MLNEEAVLAGAMEASAQSQIMQTALPLLLAQQEAAEPRIAEIQTRNRPGVDESVMFSKVMRLAEQAGVHLDQVTPAAIPSRATTPQEGLLKIRAGDNQTRQTLSGQGSYAATSEFLELLATPWAFCAIDQVRIMPNMGRGATESVSFSCTIELYAFDATPVDLHAGAVTADGGAP